MQYVKVVTESLESLGLRSNPNVMEFELGVWKHEPNPQPGPKDSGGIWVATSKSGARGLKRYFESRYGPARIFECEIGNILYQNNYRTKTDKVRLITEL